MSSNVTNIGFFAILKTAVDDKTREDLTEHFYKLNIPLSINYEGTLVYSVDETVDEYGITFFPSSLSRSPESFLEILEKEGLEIEEDSILGYSCTWYNGSDSDMDMLTLDEYRSSRR